MNIDFETVVTKNDDHAAEAMNGEIVLMHTENGKYFALGETGSLIWSLLDQPTPVGDICAHLMDKYHVDQAVCRTDLIGYLRDLAQADIITIVNN